MANSKVLTMTGRIICKIVEAIYWVASGLMLAYAVMCLVDPSSETARWLIRDLTGDYGFGVYGLEVKFLGMNSATAGATYIMCAIRYGLISLAFHNVSACLKIAERETPFQPRVQHMIRNVGFFAIAGFIILNIGNMVLRHLADLGGFGLTLSVYAGLLILGVLLLCLSQLFKRGIELESEVEGLI